MEISGETVFHIPQWVTNKLLTDGANPQIINAIVTKQQLVMYNGVKKSGLTVTLLKDKQQECANKQYGICYIDKWIGTQQAIYNPKDSIQ